MPLINLEHDEWDRVVQRRREFLVAAGMSAADADAVEGRLVDEETATTWALIETQGCSGLHALHRCDQNCVEEEWRSTINGPEGDAATVGLTLAAALERLGRRSEALSALVRARARDRKSARVRLAHAKLLFRAGHKSEASLELDPLLVAWRRQVCRLTSPTHASPPDVEVTSSRVAGDAFYISGWVSIHADDHTRAYQLWAEGAALVPEDARLVRQRRKAACWAPEFRDVQRLSPSCCLDLRPTRLIVPDSTHEPALSLFDETSQGRAVAFVTGVPLVSASECAYVLDTVNAHVRDRLSGVWGTVRRSSVPTTDIAVEDAAPLVPWLRSLLGERLFPFIAECFPVLRDGSTLGPGGTRLRVHDAFIVRYDATPGGPGSVSLPEHSDTSAISVSIALNAGGGTDYAGGGTWVRALAATPCHGVVAVDAGHALVFAGPLRHGGHTVTQGVRIILVLFLYVEGFAYGAFLGHSPAIALQSAADDQTASQAKVVRGTEALVSALPPTEARSFVVYRETAQLMEALDSGGDV